MVNPMRFAMMKVLYWNFNINRRQIPIYFVASKRMLWDLKGEWERHGPQVFTSRKKGKKVLVILLIQDPLADETPMAVNRLKGVFRPNFSWENSKVRDR